MTTKRDIQSWKQDFWYVTLVEGRTSLQNSWNIEALSQNGERELDTIIIGLNYKMAKEICFKHNQTVWNIDRDFDPELRGVEFEEGMEYGK